MIIGGRELILHQRFVQALLELEKWAGRHDARKGRALVKRIVDFARDTKYRNGFIYAFASA